MRNGKYEKNGDVYWYKDDVLHREDGPAIEWSFGGNEWYENGEYHRIDGPAVEWSFGRKEWWVNGVRHRLDGPAIQRADGIMEWFIQGTKVDITLIEYDGVRSLTDEEITYLLLCS